jgi:glycosyltransferase involved in cell wall biosynthesis
MTWFLQAELHIAAKRFYFQKLIPFSARQSQQVIADSESTRRDIVNLLGIPDDRVRVVYLGIETQRFHPVEDDDWKAKIEKRYGVGSKTYILYVGGIHPRKNIISLVKAFSLLKKRGFSEKLVLAGGLLFGNTELLEALKRLSLNNDVVLAGQVPDDDLPALYSNASVLAYPSLYEGFGFPVLEGMACGTPVVTSDASSLPEVAGEAGMLADPNSVEDISEKLSAVLSNPELSSHMRNRGFEQARKFSWELTAKQTLAVYEQAFRSWKDGSSR